MIFFDRKEVGRLLAEKLTSFASDQNAIILGLARGGVIVAAEISRILNIPLDIIILRKIGMPENPEYALGAIDEEGNGIFHEELIASSDIPREYILREIEKEKKEIARRLKAYRHGRALPHLLGKTVLLVDDGIATGATMKTAILSAKKKGAKKVIVAVPVGAADTMRELEKTADMIFCLHSPEYFAAVGQFYKNFEQVEDEEIMKIFQK